MRTPKAKEEEAQPPHLTNAHTLHFDGAVKKKMERAVAGIVIHDPTGIKLFQEGFLLPAARSNNEAKYAALIARLEKCVELGITRLCVYGDAMLIIRQIRRTWACKNFGLVPHMKKVKQLMGRFQAIELHHVLQAQNQEADALS